MDLSRTFQRHCDLLMIAVIVLFVAIVAALVAWLTPAELTAETGTLNVPLGVEQAAIVTYSGPKVTVAPYKWGVAVNVRIATVTEQEGTRVYDVRYIVNRGGSFDLKDYLVAENGGALEGLPSFKFNGDPKLSKNLDTRIQETEEVTVDIGGHYYATLTALAVAWVLWLLLLLFWKRRPALADHEITPAGPTLAEMLRSYVSQLQADTLDAAAKAKMEMLLLRRWREELALADQPMHASLVAMERHDDVGAALRQLQRWLHDPRAKTSVAKLAQVLEPYTREPAPVGVPV